MKKVEVIQVVRTILLTRGKGIEGSPIRYVEQYWSLDGILLAENDPVQNTPGVFGAPPNTIEIVEAPGDRCGNTRKVSDGTLCPGCRACR